MNVRKELLPLTQAIHPPFLSPPGSPTRWSWAVGRAGMAAGLRGVSCVHWRQVCPTSENISFSSAERVSQCYILSLPLLSPVCVVPTVPGSKSPSPCSVRDSPSDLEQVTAPCPKRKTRNFLRAGSPISAILVISAEVVLTGTSLPSSLLPLCKLMTSPNLCVLIYQMGIVIPPCRIIRIK